ncbi:MAG: TlpA family protein disulfide reductase [Acidobacteria bacterium]|nr:TlpA family protein disulfide reductase [Acidobacteriota bacterium]
MIRIRAASLLAALLHAVLLPVLLPVGCRSGDRERGASESAPPLSAQTHTDPFLDLNLQDPQGRTIRLADFGGKVRVFDLWATWCGPCREGIPHLNAIYERYRDRGLVVVGISVDASPAAVVEFTRAVPMRYPSGMLNGQASALFGDPEAIPTTFVVDRSGRAVRVYHGLVDAATLEREILDLL